MSITAIIGPMFAGKTSRIIEIANSKTDSGETVKMIKYSKDTRYNNCGDSLVVSHDDISYPADSVSSLSEMNIFEILESNVFIDEGQFFSDLREFSESCKRRGINVYISGLDTDYLQRKFPEIERVLPVSDNIERLTANCSVCGNEAEFTKRKIESDELILIGGNDFYEPVCKRCIL